MPNEVCGVVVRANDVIKNKDGTFTLLLPSRTLTKKERKLIRDLYPNLVDRAYDLLSQEALLGSLVTDGEHEPMSESPNDQYVSTPTTYEVPPPPYSKKK